MYKYYIMVVRWHWYRRLYPKWNSWSWWPHYVHIVFLYVLKIFHRNKILPTAFAYKATTNYWNGMSETFREFREQQRLLIINLTHIACTCAPRASCIELIFIGDVVEIFTEWNERVKQSFACCYFVLIDLNSEHRHKLNEILIAYVRNQHRFAEKFSALMEGNV